MPADKKKNRKAVFAAMMAEKRKSGKPAPKPKKNRGFASL